MSVNRKLEYSMKISVICKSSEWQIEMMKKTAAQLGIAIDVRDILPGTYPEDLGEIVLWRSSSLGASKERQEVMQRIMKEHILINRCLAKFPNGAKKAFQQEHVKKHAPLVHSIETFRFTSHDEIIHAVNDGILRYPFIQKPNAGSKGEGVYLIKNEDDIRNIKEVEKHVYQNFIKNTGDYRVFMLGGKPLGVIKRIAKEGNFLNNVSQGGTAIHITDPTTIKPLQHIGATIASIFDLSICGVDVIYDEDQKTYTFLEVNTVPQWQGFQEATDIDVSQEILLYCKRLAERKSTATFDLVLNEYTSQTSFLSDKKFHFLSRMYLWTKDSSYKEQLDILRESYIGRDASGYAKTIEELFQGKDSATQKTSMIAGQLRKECFEKYPDLKRYLDLLFKYLFAKTIYNIDLRPYIEKFVSDDTLLKLKDVLEQDKEALKILSTHAINYLYLTEYYLGKDRCRLQVEKYIKIGSSYKTTDKDSFKLQLYFFTHCIIGASRFYSEKINDENLGFYIQMIETIENIIEKNFDEISLDNKFEFLVCAKMCNFQSRNEAAILEEASHSLSPNGNFLIDTLNKTTSPATQNDFIKSEHRNVLYIMSQTPFHALSSS